MANVKIMRERSYAIYCCAWVLCEPKLSNINFDMTCLSMAVENGIVFS